MAWESPQQAPPKTSDVTAQRFRLAGEKRSAGTTALNVCQQRRIENYASPSVSNIAALIASVADFPAQITNCIAG